jgi:hypothetical protein
MEILIIFGVLFLLLPAMLYACAVTLVVAVLAVISASLLLMGIGAGLSEVYRARDTAARRRMLITIASVLGALALVGAILPQEQPATDAITIAPRDDYRNDTGRFVDVLRVALQPKPPATTPAPDSLNALADREFFFYESPGPMTPREGESPHWRKDVSGYRAWVCFHPAPDARHDFESIRHKCAVPLRGRLRNVEIQPSGHPAVTPFLIIHIGDARVIASPR